VRSVISYLILILILAGRSTLAQDLRIDSLKQVLSSMDEDSSKVNTLNRLAYQLCSIEPQEAIYYASQAIDLARRIEFQEGLAAAFKNTGFAYYMQGNYREALTGLEKALDIYILLGNELRIEIILSDLGSTYYSLGGRSEAIGYLLRALAMAEKMGDKSRVGSYLLNIGEIYSERSNTLDSAMYYYSSSIELSESKGDMDLLGAGIKNMGEVYTIKEEYDPAMYYYKRSLTLVNQPMDIISSLSSIGSIYCEIGEYEQANVYLNDALEMAEKEKVRSSMVSVLLGMAHVYEQTDDVSMIGVRV